MEKTETKTFIVTVLKGVGITLLSVLVGILIFSIVVKIACLSNGVIKIVNQFIKTIAIFLGCFMSVKAPLGIVKGALVGAFGTLLIYLVFAILGGSIAFGVSFLIDLLLGTVIGGISGIITVNVKQK